jgi:hypothetical protein
VPEPSNPEVRQNRLPEHWLFGSVAVKADENRWGVMNPANGGHWATDDEVADWTPLDGDPVGTPGEGEE